MAKTTAELLKESADLLARVKTEGVTDSSGKVLKAPTAPAPVVSTPTSVTTPVATPTPVVTTPIPVVTPTITTPTPSSYIGTSIVDYLKSSGQSSDYASRATLAQKYGISNYVGSAEQNTQLLNLLKSGSSVAVEKTAVSIPTSEEASGMTDEQKSQKIAELVAAGADWSDIEKYYTTVSSTGKTKQELTDEIYTKYGISDLETKFNTRPTETFEEIYKRVSESLNLADLTTKINDVIAKISKADADYAEATQSINENPWKSEAGRVGQIRVFTDKYNATKAGLQNQQTLLTNELERGKTQAQNVATQTLSEFDKSKEYTKEELDYYIKRADADIEAEMGTQETETQKELLRYFPEYATQYAVSKNKATTGEVKETDATRVNKVQALINSKRGNDLKAPGGGISWETYAEAAQLWISLGGTGADFKISFPPETLMDAGNIAALPSSLKTSSTSGSYGLLNIPAPVQ